VNGTRIPVRRALISVWDKTGLEEFAERLVAMGVEIVSSGGTSRALAEAGIAVVPVEEVTGSPEILGGRVKTLHPRIHGAILADASDTSHKADLERMGIVPFQLVVVNLYPFEKTIAQEGVTIPQAIEKIDIGGPAMVRAAAKNHPRVGVVTRSDQYEEVALAVEGGGLDADLRGRLAREAFFHTAAYDAAIVAWLERSEPLPERLVLPMRRAGVLRYGENPHQPAAAYRREGGGGWWDSADQLQGKPMSFNNLADAEAAWRLVNEFAGPAAVIVKHTNACGAAVAADPATAFAAAWDCDPVSAFGGVVAVNRPVDPATADLLASNFVEVVVAPKFADESLDRLTGKKGLRILEAEPPDPADLDLRRIDDGLLVQARDVIDRDRTAWEMVTAREPDEREWADLEFAWVVAGHTKSNAIVVASGLAAVGVGAGDQSRIGAARRAVARAGERSRGAVAASDAFFPFRDGLDVLADAGVTAVIEPGGSRRDEEVITAADERGIALVFSGVRHFRH
jgi:phosphoribosylaminoimidazolecarboxamide formyltransferase / IMP cyclohydrolase